MARRVLPLLAALLIAGAAGTLALGSSRNVVAHTDKSWKAAVRPVVLSLSPAACSSASRCGSVTDARARATRCALVQAGDGKVHVVKVRRDRSFCARRQKPCSRAVATVAACACLPR